MAHSSASRGAGRGGEGRSVTWLFARVSTIRRFKSEDTGGGRAEQGGGFQREHV